MTDSMHPEDQHVRDLTSQLRTLKPRTPHVDLDAMCSTASATNSESTNIPLAQNTSLFNSTAIRPAMTLLSGVAVGALITYVSMQWVVVSDLRSEIAELKNTSVNTASPSQEEKDPSVFAQQHVKPSLADDGMTSEVASPRNGDIEWTVGWFRTRAHRLVYSTDSAAPRPQRTVDSTETTSSNTPSSSASPSDPADMPANRALLQRELGRSIH